MHVEVCVDSGCGKSTTGPHMANQLGYSVKETPQSRQGHYFIGLGGEKYPNKGSVNFAGKDEGSRNCLTKFNIADSIEQALASVAEMNDAGNLVLFDTERSYSIPSKSPEAAAIRRALARCRKATKIHRRKNSFFLPLWVRLESTNKITNSAKGALFQGHGSRP